MESAFVLDCRVCLLTESDLPNDTYHTWSVLIIQQDEFSHWLKSVIVLKFGSWLGNFGLGDACQMSEQLNIVKSRYFGRTNRLNSRVPWGLSHGFNSMTDDVTGKHSRANVIPAPIPRSLHQELTWGSFPCRFVARNLKSIEISFRCNSISVDPIDTEFCSYVDSKFAV